MTREQHKIKVQLEQVQQEFLEQFGWTRNGKYWAHPLVSNGNVSYPLRDAVFQTYANPLLAMGGRL